MRTCPHIQRRCRVSIFNRQSAMRIPAAAIRRLANRIIAAESGAAGAQISISFLTDRAMRSLNRRYHRRDRPTDVLAFPLGREGELIADIFISTDTCRRQAKLYGNPPQRELLLYVIHGLLHLLGYDDHAAADIKRMRAAEARYLSCL